MNVRTVAFSLIAVAALSLGAIACGGGKSSADKTKAAGSGTPSAGTTASASAAANKTAAGTATGKTPAATNSTPGSTNQTPGAAGTPAAGTSPAADVTVQANGTATNSQGTPVAVPPTVAAAGATPAPAATPAAGATLIPGATRPIDPTAVPGSNTGEVATSVPGSTPRISIEAPATASGDFAVSIRLDGLTQSYTGFNIYLTFDASIVDATGSAAGTTLASSPDQIFCAKKADKIAGAEGLGCTILGPASTTTNGILATFNFKRVGGGIAVIHMSSYRTSGSTAGTYVIVDNDPDPAKSNPTPLDVALNDATVTVS